MINVQQSNELMHNRPCLKTEIKYDMFYDYGLLFLFLALLSSIDAISMFALALARSRATSISEFDDDIRIVKSKKF
jgi:hypothetical protein